MVGKALCAMMEYFGADRKSIAHALKVHGFAVAIAHRESLDAERRDLLECAAALHDIGVPESLRLFGSNTAEYQQVVGTKVARELLESLQFSTKATEHICFLIAHHHSHQTEGGPTLQILIEAECLAMLDEGTFDNTISPMEIRDHVFRTQTGRDLLNSMFKLYPLPPLPEERRFYERRGGDRRHDTHPHGE